MTVSTAEFLPLADRSVVEAEVRHLLNQRSTVAGVLALRVRPVWDDAAEFQVSDVTSGSATTGVVSSDVTVRVVACATVLAVRHALSERRYSPGSPLVILTDLTTEQLGDGICDHLVSARPRSPDPWRSLRQLFAADQQEAALLGGSNEAARAALKQLGGEGHPPAAGGVLTRELLIRELARSQFDLDQPDPSLVDLLVWSSGPHAAARFAEWTSSSHPALVDHLFEHYRRAMGDPAAGIIEAWRRGGPADLLPLGLVVALLSDTNADSPVMSTAVINSAVTEPSRPSHAAARDITSDIRVRLEPYVGDATLGRAAVDGWAQAAVLALGRLPRASGMRAAVQRRADALVTMVHAEALVERSDYIPMALARRIDRFAGLAAKAENSWAESPDGSTVPDPAAMESLEGAWNRVHDHAVDAEPGRDVRLAVAVLRLLRFAARRPSSGSANLRLAVQGYRDEGSWVDAALNDAFVGSDNPQLATVAHRVITRVRAFRSVQDQRATVLIAGGGCYRVDLENPSVPLMIEDLLDRVVRPLAADPADLQVPVPGDSAEEPGQSIGGEGEEAEVRSTVLLVVADGMSAAAAHDVLEDIGRRHGATWQEMEFAEADVNRGRTELAGGSTRAALTALPSITSVSRCSLLSGTIATGDQSVERRNFSAWLRSNSLGSTQEVLFHKGDLEASSHGHALPKAVREAIEDTRGRPVVACVLNAIDDALDRSDPIGTKWTTESLRPLDALLMAAARVGRIVVLTSDHGHVVERREQSKQQRGPDKSARWRSNDNEVRAGEIRVEGNRVGTPTTSAILAVDEQLRYGSMKAGYHGGAALAEVVVPVAILVAGEPPAHLWNLIPAGGVPAWWVGAGASVVNSAVSVQLPVETKAPGPGGRPARRRPAPTEVGLFDPEPLETVLPVVTVASRDRVADLMRTKQFQAGHERFAFEVPVERIGALLQALIAAGGSISRARAASALGVAERRLSGTLAVVGQVLNHDGVAALTQDGSIVSLQHTVLFEQFGIH